MTDPVTHQKEEGALEARMTATLVELAGIPSVSGQEAAARAYLAARLDERLGLETQVGAAGKLLALLPRTAVKRPHGRALLLNAPSGRGPPRQWPTFVRREA